MNGYRGNPRATRKAIDGDGWLKTGKNKKATPPKKETLIRKWEHSGANNYCQRRISFTCLYPCLLGHQTVRCLITSRTFCITCVVKYVSTHMRKECETVCPVSLIQLCYRSPLCSKLRLELHQWKFKEQSRDRSVTWLLFTRLYALPRWARICVRCGEVEGTDQWQCLPGGSCWTERSDSDAPWCGWCWCDRITRSIGWRAAACLGCIRRPDFKVTEQDIVEFVHGNI